MTKGIVANVDVQTLTNYANRRRYGNRFSCC